MRALILALLASQWSPTSPVKVMPPTCGTPRQSVVSVGTSAASIPSSALPGRAWADVCVSVENATTPVVKCRADGSDPVIGAANPGDALTKGDCVRYAPPAGNAIRCISDTAATSVTVTECTRSTP